MAGVVFCGSYGAVSVENVVPVTPPSRAGSLPQGSCFRVQVGGVSSRFSKVSIRAGLKGGRGVGGVQPNRCSRTAPHTRPWRGTHAAAACQFCFAPVFMADQFAVRYVFAAADQGIVAGQGLEPWIEGEGLAQCPGETLPACAARPQLLGGCAIANRRVAGDGAFHQRQFAAAKTGAFPGGVMFMASGRLPGVNRQRLVFNRAAQGLA